MKQVLVLILGAALATGLATGLAAQDSETLASTDVSADASAEGNPEAELELATPNDAPASSIGPFDAKDVSLADFLWVKRPVVVFADTKADPRYQDQLALLLDRVEALEERDIVVITDTAPSAASEH